MTLEPTFKSSFGIVGLTPTTYRGPDETLIKYFSSVYEFKTSPINMPADYIAFKCSSVF